MKIITDKNDLSHRKWRLTELVLQVALKRRKTVQFIRSEMAEAISLSPGMISMIEKAEVGSDFNMSQLAEDRISAYLTEQLEETVVLNGNLQLALVG